MNRNEILVMEELYKQKCNNRLKALTIGTMAKAINVSYYTARNIVKGLVIGEYCALGLKNGRAETYYLTENGIKKIKELKGEVE